MKPSSRTGLRSRKVIKPLYRNLDDVEDVGVESGVRVDVSAPD